MVFKLYEFIYSRSQGFLVAQNINVIKDPYQCIKRKKKMTCKSGTLGGKAEYTCVILQIKHEFEQLTAAAPAPPFHFLTLNSPLWVNTTWGDGLVKMEECNLLPKPGPPLELWICISSSTVSSSLQLLIVAALHHRLATVQKHCFSRWFRWCLEKKGVVYPVSTTISQILIICQS